MSQRLTIAKTTQPGGFFITGTDTDVGKTFVSACLIKNLIENGLKVAPRKPIASGCIRQADGSLLPEDAYFLQQAALSNESLQTICPYQFEPAISPHTALAQAGLCTGIEDLLQACKTPPDCFALIEGAGGFFSPLATDGLNKDLAQHLQLPVVIVIANKIGCINQTLLTINAIEHSQLPIHSLIVNSVHADNDYNYAQDLSLYTDYPIYYNPFCASRQPHPIVKWQL